MKKLFGLLVIGSVGLFIACTSDESDNPYAGSTMGFCTNGTVQKLDPQTFQPLYNADGSPMCTVPATSAASSADMATSSDPGFVPTSAGVSSSSAAFGPASSVTPVVASSSSVAPVTPASSSSAVPAATSSSSKKVTPASSATPAADDGIFKLGLWDGSEGKNQVPTGNDDGGYWYSYTDSGNKGSSTLEWDTDAAVGSSYSDDDLSPVIKACGGLCGKFDLVAGNNEDCAPYVAVAFNYAKSDKTIADATASKGVCITYKSTMPIEVDLGMGSKDATYGYNNPAYILPKTASLSTVDISWSEFEQQWEGNKAITGPAAAAILAAIKLQVKGSEVGEDEGEGTFLITKFGAYGQCD